MKTGKKALEWRFIGLAVVVGFGFAANTAVAALGGFPLTGANRHVTSNVMKTAAVMKASMASMASAGSPTTAAPSSENPLYSVNVATLNSGTVVHEFVATSSHVVFAVTWCGPRQPDFVDILGTYSERYLKPSTPDVIRVGGVSQRSLSSSDLVVQSFGHMGRFNGDAYLPSAVPAGVSLSELQ